MTTVVNLSDYKKRSANTTQNIIDTVGIQYESSMQSYTSNLNTAADVALIKFLMLGAAHRTQGEDHPSQILLDLLHENLGSA